jgi:hypothetical protein
MSEYRFKPPEPTPHYEGPAEVWVDGTKWFDATVRLTGYIEATGITSFGGKQCLESVSSWDGRLFGIEQRDRFRLVGKNFETEAAKRSQRQGRSTTKGPHLVPGYGRAAIRVLDGVGGKPLEVQEGRPRYRYRVPRLPELSPDVPPPAAQAGCGKRSQGLASCCGLRSQFLPRPRRPS